MDNGGMQATKLCAVEMTGGRRRGSGVRGGERRESRGGEEKKRDALQGKSTCYTFFFPLSTKQPSIPTHRCLECAFVDLHEGAKQQRESLTFSVLTRVRVH